MSKLLYYTFSLLFLTLYACAPSRFVEPLDKNEISIGGSFGGPVIGFDAAVSPMPITSLEVGYGVDTNLTAFAAVHTTAAIFGNLQMDVGVTYQFLAQKKYIPNLSVSPSVNFVYDFLDKSGKIWPVLDANAFWNYGQRQNYFYLGVNNYFELSKIMANDQPQNTNWLFNPQIGHIIKGKQGHWQLTTEIKFLGPNLDNSTAFVPYKSLLGKNGATGFFVGYRLLIGKNSRR